jgi:hypothetical protein
MPAWPSSRSIGWWKSAGRSPTSASGGDPVRHPEHKDSYGSEAWADAGVVPRASRRSRAPCRISSSVTDVSLCEYTDHGHCGVVQDGAGPERPDARACSSKESLAHCARRARPRGAVRHDGRPGRGDPAGLDAAWLQ